MTQKLRLGVMKQHNSDSNFIATKVCLCYRSVGTSCWTGEVREDGRREPHNTGRGHGHRGGGSQVFVQYCVQQPRRTQTLQVRGEGEVERERRVRVLTLKVLNL